MVNCEKCGKELQISDWPFCPHGRGNFGVQGDECDVLVEHGLCNSDGTPRRYRSKQEMKKEAKKRGIENHVVHIGLPGSDKSPFTTRHF